MINNQGELVSSLVVDGWYLIMKLFHLFIIQSLCLLFSACRFQDQETPPPSTAKIQYINQHRNFSFTYPPDWIIIQESERAVRIVPREQESWEPEQPADIPKDPHITIQFGENVEGVLLATTTSGQLSPDNLYELLLNAVNLGSARDLSEEEINGFRSFWLTEIYESDCESVVYWRPTKLTDLVRISTGCESDYLEDLFEIAGSFRQTE